MHAPTSIREIAERVGSLLDDAIAAEGARWSAIDERLAFPFEEIRRLAAGGKRLRPAFAHWGYVGLGGDDMSMIGRVGAAIELLHVMALFHDDIADGAETRRGAATTHVRAEREHESAGWAGEARRFGEGAALLIGDLAYAMSDRLFGHAAQSASGMWNELRIEVNVGQYLDIVCSASGDRSIATADRICRYKSGKYTVERPLQLGALVARPDLDDGVIGSLSSYGLPLGDAFQMRDDVMGAFGDTRVTGKPVGNDLREGKPTPLLARAFAMASDSQRDVLSRVGSSTFSAGDVERVQAVIEETGALAEIEGLISSFRDEAIASLVRTPLSSEARDRLTELAVYVTEREN